VTSDGWARSRWRLVRDSVLARWRFVFACAVIPAAVLLGVGLAAPARYDAAATLRVRLPALDKETVRLLEIEPDAPASGNVLPDSATADHEVRRSILSRAAARLGVDEPELAEAIDVGPPRPSPPGLATSAVRGMIEVRGVGPAPHAAAARANAYAEAYVSVRNAFVRLRSREALLLARAQIAAAEPSARHQRERVRELAILPRLEAANVEIGEVALARAATRSPRAGRDAGLGALLGLWLGVACAVIREAPRRAQGSNSAVNLHASTGSQERS
jgi:hypothetical protein